MIVAHKIALDPNNVQATYFAKAAGVARFAYNWALAEWQRQYEAWKQDNSLPKPSQAALRRQLNGFDTLAQKKRQWRECGLLCSRGAICQQRRCWDSAGCSEERCIRPPDVRIS